ncbi:MAG: cobalamin B12-binding domain-containing protein, partial [Firmicutes bacterium]|nr:cobalamin B12-binding domain-containing protein [Bacillota bacterium]
MQKSGEKNSVMLINPGWQQLDEPFEHLGLGYLAASLRHVGIETTIMDVPLTGATVATMAKQIHAGGIALVGVSITFQESAREALRGITQLKKETGVTIVVGGIYPTLAAQEIMAL